MSEIGDRVRRLRNRAVLTQKQLAEKAGISQNALTQIETGRKMPRITTIQKLAAALDIPATDLVSED